MSAIRYPYPTAFPGNPSGTLTGMGRGLGPTQLGALTALADAGGEMWIDELADTLGLSPRRCRAVVHALAARDEVQAVVVADGVNKETIVRGDGTIIILDGMPRPRTTVSLMDAAALARRDLREALMKRSHEDRGDSVGPRP